MQEYAVFIEVGLCLIVGLMGYIIRGMKAEIEEVKKDSVSPDLCLKTHELDAVKIDNISKLIVRIEAQTRTDHLETRGKIEELTKVVDALKVTVLKVGQLRRRGDLGE